LYALTPPKSASEKEFGADTDEKEGFVESLALALSV
jgi:hypothetical protein